MLYKKIAWWSGDGYDYGDNWEHEIVVQSTVTDYDKNYPACLLGEGNAPPEDVGGVSGYEEFLEIMKNPKHTEYENTRHWVQSQWYKEFDILCHKLVG